VAPIRRAARACALAVLAASAGSRAAAAGTVRMVVVGSDSVSAPAVGSLRQVLTLVQPGDTIQFAQNFSIILDPKDPNAGLKLAQSGVTIQGPAELRSGVLVLLGDATTVTDMRFADFRVFAGTLLAVDPSARTADFVFRGNTLVGDSALQITHMRDALVVDNTFDVRTFHGAFPAQPGAAATAVGDYRSDGSRWLHNTWTDTSQGGFQEANCSGLVFETNNVVGDAVFQPRSGRVFDNVVTGDLRAFRSDFPVDGTLTLEKNRCATLGAARPDLEVVDNVVSGDLTGKGTPKPFSLSSARGKETPSVKPYRVSERRVMPFYATSGVVRGDSGFLTVRHNTITATDMWIDGGWIDGAVVGANDQTTDCVVELNTVAGGARRSLIVAVAKSATVRGNTVTSGGRTGAIVQLGAASLSLAFEDNTVDGGLGGGILLSKGPGVATLTNNVVKNCKGAALVATGRAVVSENGTYQDCGSGVLVGAKTSALVRGGSITGNRSFGVYAGAGAHVEVVRTSFSGNGGAGIDLAPAGVTPNTRKKTANGNVSYPDALEYDASTGRVKGKAEALARIDAYAVEGGPRAGNPANGEGVEWLGETFADATGRFTFPEAGRLTCPSSQRVTFTATRQGVGIVPVTSEFSLDADCSGAAFLLLDRTPDGAVGDKTSDSTTTVLPARYRTMSDDGRFVVFTSKATNLVADDTNATVDVFVRDTVLGSTTRVNRAADGGQVTYESTTQPDAGSAPSISSDGRFVCYTSRAEASFDTGHWYFNDPGVVLFDMQTGANTIVASPLNLVDPLPSGAYSYSGAYYASVSGDGSAVIFAARSPDYAAGDAGDDDDAFVWTRATGAYERVSVPTGGGDPTNGWQASSVTTPRLSYDARFAVFASGHNLSGTPGGTGPWLRDRQTGTTDAVCVDSTGAIHSGYDAWASDDGRFVVFWTSDSLVAADTNSNASVYLRDRQGGVTTLVSAKADGTVFYGDCLEPCISGDGRWVAFRNFEKIWLLDRQTAAMTVVSGSATVAASSYCYRPRLSRTGQFLEFETDATNLVDLGGQTFVAHVYLRDLWKAAK